VILPTLVPPVSEDYTVRPIEAADARGPYIDWINDDAVTRWLSVRFDRRQEPADLEAYIEACNAGPDTLLLAVVRRDDGAHIGNLKLLSFDWPHSVCTISLALGPDRVKGAGIQVIAMGLSLAFDAFGLYRVDAGGMTGNPAAHKAFLAVGFQDEGLSRGRYEVKGERYGCWRVGYLRDDPPVFRRHLISPAEK
jgi:ribosomal-protein-alanine N-acetyltransferase